MRKCQRTAQEGDNNWSLKERLKNNKEKRKKKELLLIVKLLESVCMPRDSSRPRPRHIDGFYSEARKCGIVEVMWCIHFDCESVICAHLKYIEEIRPRAHNHCSRKLKGRLIASD